MFVRTAVGQEVGLRACCVPISWRRILDFIPMRSDPDSPQQFRVLAVFARDLTRVEHPDDAGANSRDLLIGQGPASTHKRGSIPRSGTCGDRLSLLWFSRLAGNSAVVSSPSSATIARRRLALHPGIPSPKFPSGKTLGDSSVAAGSTCRSSFVPQLAGVAIVLGRARPRNVNCIVCDDASKRSHDVLLVR